MYQAHRHVEVSAAKPHPFERYEVDYQLNSREQYTDYDYQRYQAMPAQVVHNQAPCQKMPERVPYEYPGVAYPRPPIAARYEPYPQVKEKYVYQYPYQNPYTFIDQRKRPKSQAEELQYCQVPRHAQPFYPAPKVQTNPPCAVIDVNQKYGHHVGPYHARMKQYMPPPYDMNAVNSKAADQAKLKMDYYNHYRTPPAYPNVHYPSENYHAANYNLPSYDYSTRSPNIHYQNPLYYKPVEYRQSDKSYEVDPGMHKYYNSKLVSGNPLARIPTEFSPNVISPAESNTSFDSLAANSYQTLQEDGGYVSQCSTVSRQSADYQVKKDFYAQSCSRPYQSASSLETMSPKTSVLGKPQSESKGSLDVRKFLATWDEEYEEPKLPLAEISAKPIDNCMQSKSETEKVPELYVLDKTVISEEDVKKYEHIQKVTKLPDYIKDVGVANANRMNMNSKRDANIPYPAKLQTKKDIPMVYNTYRSSVQPTMKAPQPELFTNDFEDVEAKISQSVIHKEVRCNFEIKPLIPNQIPQLPVDDHKMKSVTPTSVPYNNVQIPQKSDKSANLNYSKATRKVQPEIVNNYLPLQNQTHQKKCYPNVVNPHMANHKNAPVNYNSLPIINVEESSVGAPMNHAKQDVHYAKPNPAYAHCAEVKTPQQYTPNTHGKVNVIMNSAYVDYKNSQAEVNQRQTAPISNQPIFKSPYGAEYKNPNLQQPNYKHPDMFNMNYSNKPPSQNNYFNISINSEKANPHYHKYAEQYPPKPSERIADSKFVKPHDDNSVNKTTNINIALMLNENKKTSPDSANRTVICRNDSNTFNKSNQENCEQYLDSKSGVLYSSRNASITIQIEKRDELEYPNFTKDHIPNNANVPQYPAQNLTYDYSQNQHPNGTSHNYQSDLADKSYELKIYETQSDDLRNDKKSIIMHSSFQQDNNLFVPEGFPTNDYLGHDHYQTKAKKDTNFGPYPAKDVHTEFADCRYEALLKRDPENCVTKPSVIDMSYKTGKNNSVIVKPSELSYENSASVINSVIPHNSDEEHHKLLEENLSIKPSMITKNDTIVPIENKSPVIVERTIKSPDKSLGHIDTEFFDHNEASSNSVINEIQNPDLTIEDLTHSSKPSNISELPAKTIVESELSLNNETNSYTKLNDCKESTSSGSNDSSSDSESDSSDNLSDTSETLSDSKENETFDKTLDFDDKLSNDCKSQTITEDSDKNENKEQSEPEKSIELNQIELKCDSKDEISEESEPLIDFQDSLTNTFTKISEQDCNPISIKNDDVNIMSDENQNVTESQILEESSVYDEFQMVYEKNLMEDDEIAKIDKTENGNSLSKHELIVDDNDSISFKNNDCEVMLETVSVDENETYISFESDKADFFCGDSDEDDARYVIIRTDEPLSYAAAIDSENDLSSDVHISRVALEDSEVSREKLNMTDGNEIEIGGYWIDDIACVETVAAEETVEAEETVVTEEADYEEENPPSNETYVPDETYNDSTESCKSLSVAWSEHSSNDESNSASIDFNNDDDSSIELLKDSNSNFITNSKDNVKENSNDVNEFDKFTLEEETSKNSNSENSYETKEEFRNSIKIKLDKSKYDSEIIERMYKGKHSKKRSHEDRSELQKRRKYSSSDRTKSESSKDNKSTDDKSHHKSTKYRSSVSESKSSKCRSYSSDAKTDVSDRSHSRNRMTLPKKPPKPKFEDVLRNIDKANIITMKLKKQKKKSIPKMIIKRNEEGSHYTSTPHRAKPVVIKNKWQPQVCLRRNNSIEKLVNSK